MYMRSDFHFVVPIIQGVYWVWPLLSMEVRDSAFLHMWSSNQKKRKWGSEHSKREIYHRPSAYPTGWINFRLKIASQEAPGKYREGYYIWLLWLLWFTAMISLSCHNTVTGRRSFMSLPRFLGWWKLPLKFWLARLLSTVVVPKVFTK
jgi:hypothetical protein